MEQLTLTSPLMNDLNDLAYFAAVADHGGFAAAGRALDMPKSTLSRRVSALETRLGVRLFQRTTRRFALTDTGRDFLAHCHAMLAEAEAAEALVAERTHEPRGTVRLSCPPALMQDAVGPMLARFLAAWPQITLHVEATNRPVDVWESGVDLAVRVRNPAAPLPAEETIRPLATSPHRLVAAPALLTHRPPPATPDDLATLPTLALHRGAAPGTLDADWVLNGPDGQTVTIPHRPRLMVDDMSALLCAVHAGVGCAVLPQLMIHDALARGDLQELLPQWTPPAGQVQVAFASRRGMRPAVRQVLDALAEGFARLAAEGRCLKAH